MRHDRGAVFAAIIILPTVFSSSAFAQQSAGGIVSLDGITVTSTKTEGAVVDALAGASVVGKDYLENFQVDEVSEIFRGVPGVETQSDGNDPSTAINIRGLQDFGRVNVLIEGARQDFQRSGHGADGVFYLEPELIKSVDVTRGPVSTIYGSGAIGGVVNFELIDAGDILREGETWAAQQKLQYDTNDNGYLSSSIFAARPTDSFELLGNFIYRQDDNYSDGNGRELEATSEDIGTGLLKGKLNLGGGHELTAIGSYQESDYLVGETDFALLSGNGITPLRDTDTRSSNVIGKYEFDSPDTDLINLKTNFYYTETETEQFQLEDGTSTTAGSERFFRIQTVGFDAFNTSEFATGPLSHALSYGVDGFKDEVKTGDNDPAGTADEFTPSGERTVIGGFIQNQISYSDWLEIIGAVRFDHFELDGGDTELSGSEISPKVTVGITPIQGIQFYGTYAEGFRAPAVTEVFNDGTHDPAFPFTFAQNLELEPETAQNYEVGANIKFDDVLQAGDRFRAKATYFHNTIENYIEADVRGLDAFSCFVLPGPPFFLPPSNCGVYQFVNIAEAEIKGFELEASYDNGTLFSTVAYSRIRGDDTVLNQPLESIRPDKVSFVFGGYLLDQKLKLGVRYSHVAKQDRIPLLASDGSENTLAGLEGNAHSLVDLFGSYQVNEDLKFGVVLNNIFDEQYAKYLDQNFSEGFSASFTGTVRFGG